MAKSPRASTVPGRDSTRRSVVIDGRRGPRFLVTSTVTPLQSKGRTPPAQEGPALSPLKLDRTKRWLVILDRAIGAVTSSGLALVLPLSLLLFLQWPLRDLVQAYSREANDLAQCLFALYVSVAITYATRKRSHLAADALARKYAPAKRERIYRLASLCILVPWSAFMLFAAGPMLVQSVMQLERFPDTYNAGYSIVKSAVGLAALLVLLQAIVDVLRDRNPESL